MKIILLKNIKNLGEKGNIINVKNGYAKNFLLPQKIAINKTYNNLKNINKITNKNNIEDKIENTCIIIAVKEKNDNYIYGSINKNKLSKIFKKLNIKINTKNIDPKISIRKTGNYKIEINNKNKKKININLIIAKIKK